MSAAAAAAPRRHASSDYHQPRVEKIRPNWDCMIPSQFLDEFGRRARGLGEYLMVAKILQQTLGCAPKPRPWVAISDEEFSAVTLLTVSAVRMVLDRIAVEEGGAIQPQHVILFRRSPAKIRSGPRFEYRIIRENLSAGKERDLRILDRPQKHPTNPGLRVVCSSGRSHTFWSDTESPTRVRNAGKGTFEAECIETEGQREIAVHVISADPTAESESAARLAGETKGNDYHNPACGSRESEHSPEPPSPQACRKDRLRAWLRIPFADVFRKPLDEHFLDRLNSKLGDATVEDLQSIYTERYESFRKRGKIAEFKSGLMLSLAESAAAAAEQRKVREPAPPPPGPQLIEPAHLNPAEDFESPWAAIKLRLQKKVSGIEFRNWVQHTAPLLDQPDAAEIRIFVRDQVTREWMEQEYGDLVRKAIGELKLTIERVTYWPPQTETERAK